ncbi:MAG: hypothetical protein ACKV22_30455 [Bryobacteraceae bacterium]
MIRPGSASLFLLFLLNPSPAKTLISAGNKTVQGVAMGNRKAEMGLAIADRHTERGVNGACAKVERSLKKSRDSVARFLRRGKKPGVTRDAGKR